MHIRSCSVSNMDGFIRGSEPHVYVRTIYVRSLFEVHPSQHAFLLIIHFSVLEMALFLFKINFNANVQVKLRSLECAAGRLWTGSA